VGQHLSFTHDRKVTKGYTKVRTGLGRSDRPGSQGGLVCPAKAGVFSGRQSHRGRSQRPVA
jgi:hypothetical protein